jgi:hypothetical protein
MNRVTPPNFTGEPLRATCNDFLQAGDLISSLARRFRGTAQVHAERRLCLFRWMLRTLVRGRRRDLGLGGLNLVPLAEVREQALQYRRIARAGGDPFAERRKAQIIIPTFGEAARIVHTEHKSAWKNAKHAAQWLNTLSEYAFPIIGG